MSRSGGDRAFRSLRREAGRRPNSACVVCAQQHQHADSVTDGSQPEASQMPGPGRLERKEGPRRRAYIWALLDIDR